MCNRKNTMVLAAVLDKLGIDIKTEFDVAEHQAPTVADHYAVLSAARTLALHGIPVHGVDISGENLIVIDFLQLKDTVSRQFGVIMTFDKDLKLITTTVDLDVGTTPSADLLALANQPNNQSNILMFTDVDIRTMVPVTALLGSLTNRIYEMVFSSDYDPDMVRMLMLSIDDMLINRAICINGQAYTVIYQGKPDIVDQETGIADLLLVLAYTLANKHPEVGTLDVVTDGESGLLCFDTE